MEKSKLKICKVCNAEVAKSAKTCPHCGAKLKKGHPVLIAIIILIVLFAIIGSSGDSNEPKKVDGSAPEKNTESITTVQETESEPEEKTEFYVGETAELKGVRVTLVGVTKSSGSTYNAPTDGNEFVLCEFEIENNSNSEINVSSAMSFEAYCDDYTCTFSFTALMEKGNKNQLDGTVAPEKKFNGVIGYEVPVDWEKLEVIFTPDFLSGNDITFVATNE